MKKIIVGIFTLAILIVGGNQVSASGWNQYPGDCPAINVANATTGQGAGSPCWTGTNVQASSGQVINVKVFYDNTNGADAGNTTISLTQSPSSGSQSSNFTFSGGLTSSAGNLPFSQVSTSISTSQTLTFSQSKWYKNGSGSPTSFPSGQSGQEAFSGGLNLGTIPNTEWGAVVFSFTVGTTMPPNNCAITNFTVNGGQTAYINSGQAANLSWTTNDCSSVTVTGPNGTISTNPNGSSTVYPNYSGTYTVNAYGNGGASPTRSVYVNVTNNQTNNCYINNFTANGGSNAYINYNDSVDLYWNTTGCDNVNISSIGSVNQNGNQTVYPYSSRNYTLTAYSYSGNTQTRTVYVNVNGNNGGGGGTYCYINNFTANGSSNAYINSGQAVNIVWNTNGCSSVNVYGPNLNSYQTSGYQTIYPTSSGTYRITAYGYNGSAPSQTIYVTVNPVIINPPVYNACAVTTVATSVTENSATLNGLLTSSASVSYFEYGRTINLGSQTSPRSTSGSMSEVISGLSANTSYFFRFVSNCGGSLSYGKIEVFTTAGNIVRNTIVRPIVVQGTTVVGTESPIMLKIENRYRAIGVGDIIDYTITYKNIGKSKLTKPVLQVVVPKGITATNTSAGTFDNDTNTLTVELLDFNPGDEGVTYLQGRVDSIDSNTAQIVTTAILVYTTPNGAQENAIAYVLNSPKDIGNVLGASAFWSGLGNIGLIGWLLLAIIILLIILLTRKYNKSVVHTTTPNGNHTTTTTHY